MREQNYLDRAKLNPARTFKTPMDVVETDDIDPAAKLVILKAWEADERRCKRPSLNLGRSLARPAQPSRRLRGHEYWSTPASRLKKKARWHRASIKSYR
jgi:hypothetical protein